MQHFDVAIIGGGLVGASLARSLASSKIKIVVIDNQPAEAMYAPELDNRGLALSYTSAQILNNINVWDTIVDRAFPIQTVHVSEQGSFGFAKLEASKYNLPALGYVISASALGASLIYDLGSVAGVNVFRPAQITDVDFDVDQQTWNLAVGSKKIRANLLVAADGSDSFVRTQQGIQAKTKEFDQTAIVTNIHMQKLQTNIAYERFTPHGVLALLPFGNKQMKCVWTVDNNLAELIDCSDAEFLQKIQYAIGFRLGKLISVTQRKTFPIRQIIADQLYGKCSVFIGNAANTLHPVAAQGFNLGLRDVNCLSKLICIAKYKNESINSPRLLQQYAAQRKTDHNTTQNYTERLINIFSNESPIIKVSRRAGLIATQISSKLNTRVTVQGLGICE